MHIMPFDVVVKDNGEVVDLSKIRDQYPGDKFNLDVEIKVRNCQAVITHATGNEVSILRAARP